MSKSFTKADLKNIDFDAIREDCHGFFNIDNVINYSFEVILKDGRKFTCNQDLLDHVFTIHSDKRGDIKGNMFVKMAADLIGDNDRFIAMIEGATIFAQDIMGDYTGYPADPQPEEILLLTSTEIVKKHFFNDAETLAIKLLEMGLDENIDYVTIKPFGK